MQSTVRPVLILIAAMSLTMMALSVALGSTSWPQAPRIDVFELGIAMGIFAPTWLRQLTCRDRSW
jgi:hypothetical protein